MSRAYYAGNWPAAIGFLFSGPAFGWHAEAGIHILRVILSGALDGHPRLKLLSGHWGEFVAGWLDRLDEVVSWGGTHLERQVSAHYREQVWATPSGMYSQNQLNFIVAEIRAERFIYAEDFPYVVRDNVSEFLEQADLTDDQRTAIAHRNAEETWDPQTTHSGGTGWATDRLAPNVIHRRAVPVSHVAVSHGGCQRRTTLNRPDNLYFVVDREM